MLQRRNLALLLAGFALGAVIGGVAGVFIFLRVIGGTGEPSAPISAPTLSLDATQAPPDPIDSAPMATNVAAVATQVALVSTAAGDIPLLRTEVAGLGGQVETLAALEANHQQSASLAQAVTATPTPRPTSTPRPTQTFTSTPSVTPTALPNQRLFRIVPEESEVRFIVDEIMPRRNGLVGSTNQVAGDIIVDLDHPPNSRVGTIRINLRTLRTDEPGRDQVLRGEILLSARPEYEFSDFVPTTISGLPDSVSIGQPLNFQVTGNFPVRGVSHSLTFDVTATLVSETQLEGLGTATINRADYGLLQSALADHGVSEEIKLEIQFVARAVEQ